MSLPSLSVVAVAWPDLRGVTDTLQALDGSVMTGCDITIVAPQAQPDEIKRRFPWARWIEKPGPSLIPHLWAEGIAASTGDVVATTTTHFHASAGWIDSIRKAHAESSAPAIGGPIDPPENGSAVAWAVYLIRYSAYPTRATSVLSLKDLAGDNAAYKRTALDKHPASVRDGFWERDLHQALLAEGSELLFDPRLRVRQHASFDFSTFFAQRFHHGQQFGRARLRGRSKVLGLLGTIAAITLVLPLLMARTTTRAISARHPLGNILAALPALVAFATAWSAGEAIGYLKYAAGDRPEATA